MSVIEYESILSEELFLEIKDYIKYLTKKEPNIDNKKLTTSIGNWEDGVIKSSIPIIRHKFDIEDIEIYTKVKKEIEKIIPYIVTDVIIHIMPKLSYIPWHKDSHCKAALSVYLNDIWDEDWGGFLMYKEENIIKCIKPVRNLGILQKGGTSHCVTTINMDADYRYSIQFFLSNEKKIM